MAFDLTEVIDRLPPLKIPGLHSTESIGIDIGSSTIKIIQLKKQSAQYQLLRWSVIPVSSLGEAERKDVSPEEKKAQIVNLLKTYRGSGKKMPKNAITSVSGNMVIVRYVKFPKLTTKELAKTIKTEAEPYIPFNIEEVYMGFHILRDVTEEGKEKMEAVLVAAKKDFVNQQIEMLQEAGFKAAVVDVDAFALESCYEAMQETPTAAEKAPEETVLIANMGQAKTNFSIIENGVSIVVKDSPIAGATINKAITKILGADSKTAEKLKNTNGILFSQEEKEAALLQNQKEALGVSDACMTMLRDLTSEIKKIMQYFITTQSAGRRIHKILICGGCANIKNFDKALEAELNLPVEKLNPFKKISGAEGVPEEYYGPLAIATGLAMRKPGDIKI